jgi:hypothetical protein
MELNYIFAAKLQRMLRMHKALFFLEVGILYARVQRVL